MALTRFNDDPCRISKKLQQMTDQGRWILDVPGNGDKPCFILDPQIIPQKWGANLMTNVTDVQSYLLGITNNLNRDCINNSNEYKKLNVRTVPISYPICDNFLTTEQSRAIMPPWTSRENSFKEHRHILLHNPQENIEIPFDNLISTRILEKDNFSSKKCY